MSKLIVALFGYLGLLGSLSANPSYEIFPMAPKGKEFVTQSGEQIAMTRSGYVYGTINTGGPKIYPWTPEKPFIYNVHSGQFDILDFGDKSSISLVNEQGWIAGHRNLPEDAYYFNYREGYLLNSTTGEDATIPLFPWPYEHRSPTFIGITAQKKAYLMDSDYKHYFAYNLDTKILEDIPDEGIIKVNLNGQYVFQPRLNWYSFTEEIWFHDPEKGKLPIGDYQFSVLNEEGFVAGSAKDSKGRSNKGFVWSLKSGIKTFKLHGDSLIVNGLNSKGQVVGAATFQQGNQQTHAFFYDPAKGGVVDLGTIADANSSALAVDDKGTVVGNCEINQYEQIGFIWDSKMGLRLLQDLLPKNSGWRELTSISISKDGYILGKGLFYGVPNYFILKSK